MGIWLESFASCFNAPDARTISVWSYDNVEPPQSARATRLDVSVTPWLREPMDFAADNRVNTMVIMAPTGAGKTTLFDGIIPWAITEDPGNVLCVLQTDPDAKEYAEERLMPIFRKVPQIATILDSMDRHSIRKDAIQFPHLKFWCGGANLTTLQRKSARWCLGDEVWLWKHGYVKEFFARMHDRWNRRGILVSQGGVTDIVTDAGLVPSELNDVWLSTDQREWCFACPDCGDVQRFRFKGLLYETIEKEDSTLDEAGIFQSAHYSCLGRCGRNFDDTVQNRRALAQAGRYVESNARHLPGRHGWHCNALSLHYLPWGSLAVELAKAHYARKRGDDEPIRIFRQKRMAENYRIEEAAPPADIRCADYSLLDFANGELWDGESRRFLTVDVQKGHFWVIARAWKADASSRLLYEGKISTWEGIRELQQKLKVIDRDVGVDAGYNVDDDVLNHCAEYGWLALNGDSADRYRWALKNRPVEFRLYSTVKNERGTAGKISRLVTWSNRGVKRLLERFRDGRREPHEIPMDVSEDYKHSMFSEVEKDVMNKKTRRLERRFVVIGSRRNHKWDCECMQIVMALIYYILAVKPETTEEPKDAQPEGQAA